VPRRHLRETLEELERELENAAALDAESRARLEHAVRDVRQVLERSEDADVAPEDESLLDRLDEVAREFRNDHPTLAAVVGRVATALSNLGI
jgi:hypothetical protein